MIFFKYFDVSKNQKTILINTKQILYCTENLENSKCTDIKFKNGEIVTVNNNLSEVLIAILKLKMAYEDYIAQIK